MNLEEKREVLLDLGQFFESCTLHSKNQAILKQSEKLKKQVERGAELIDTVHHENGWFTPDSVKAVFEAWSKSLTEENISKWLTAYSLENTDSKAVGVIMAGNIPLVGLHDALCVLITDHHLKAKLSSKDKSLMSLLLETIAVIAPKWTDKIEVTDNLKDIDYLIATGSDNSNRYFEYYFRDVKKILRKNRTSVAILDGNESEDDLKKLSHDVFMHFGLGCRNVTKLFLPKDFDLDRIFNAFFHYKEIVNNNKYANNYDYNKAVYLLNKIDLVENGFLLLKEDEELHSPVGVLFYEYYDKLSDVEEKLIDNAESIQAAIGSYDKSKLIPFGKAQQPELWDYADGVDTIEFLIDN